MCLIVGRAYGIPTVALRFFNVYGPRQALSNPYTGVLAIFAVAPAQRQAAARSSRTAAAARLRQRPRRRARLPARARSAEARRAGVQRRQRPARTPSREIARAHGRGRWARRDSQPEITGKYRVGDIRHCFADIALARAACSATSRRSTLDEGLAELAAWLEGQVARRPRRRGAAPSSTRGGSRYERRDRCAAGPDHRRRRLHRHQPRRTACSRAASRCVVFDNLSRPGVEQNLAWLREQHGDRVELAIGDVRDADAVERAVARRRARVPLRRAGRGHHQPRRSASTTSRSTRAARSTCSRPCARAGTPPPLVFTSTNKVYGALDDVALRGAAARYEPARRAVARARHRRGAAARLPQPLRLLEGRGRPVRPRLRAQLRPPRRRVPHELHLRPAPVRHRGPGLGRALPDPRARAASRSPSTATACRCATSSSSTTWSTPSCCARAQHRRALAGSAFNIGGGPANTSSLLELLDRIERLTGRAARVDVRAVALAAISATTSPTPARSTRAPAGARRVGVGEGDRAPRRVARASSARTEPRRAARGGVAVKVALVNPPWSFEGSIYFGCREPHLPLEYGYAKALLEARGARGRCSSTRSSRGLDHATALRDARRARLAPDMTVVTTAPSYLFWRCAPPELRVPHGDGARDARRRRRSSSRSGPTRRRRRGATLRKLGADVAVLGECEDVARRARARRRDLVARARVGRVVSRRRRVAANGGPHAADMSDAAGARAGRRRDVRAARAPSPSLRLAAATGPGRRSRRRAAAPITARSARRTTSATRTASARSRRCSRSSTGCIAQGVRYVYFIDEIFLPDRALLEALAAARRRSSACRSRIDNWSREMLDLLGARRLRVDRSGRGEHHARRAARSSQRAASSRTERARRAASSTRSGSCPFVQANLLDERRRSAEAVAAWREHLARARRVGEQARAAVPLSGLARLHDPVGHARRRRVGARARRTTSAQFDHFSDIQDEQPRSLAELERVPAHG